MTTLKKIIAFQHTPLIFLVFAVLYAYSVKGNPPETFMAFIGMSVSNMLMMLILNHTDQYYLHRILLASVLVIFSIISRYAGLGVIYYALAYYRDYYACEPKLNDGYTLDDIHQMISKGMTGQMYHQDFFKRK